MNAKPFARPKGTALEPEPKTKGKKGFVIVGAEGGGGGAFTPVNLVSVISEALASPGAPNGWVTEAWKR